MQTENDKRIMCIKKNLEYAYSKYNFAIKNIVDQIIFYSSGSNNLQLY